MRTLPALGLLALSAAPVPTSVPARSAQDDVPLHQKPEVPLLMRRRAELEKLAASRPAGELRRMAQGLDPLYSGGRPRPDVRRAALALAEARARLLGTARDEDTLRREALFLYAYPEVADPREDAAVHLTLRALWAVELGGDLRVRFRIRDASGRVVARQDLPEAVGREDLLGYRVSRAFPAAALPDGHYVGEAVLVLDGRPPRPGDPAASSLFSVRRGFLERVRQLGARRAQAGGAGDQRMRACVDALLWELERALRRGDPFELSTDLPAVLEEAERRLGLLLQGRSPVQETEGEVAMGLRTSLGGLHLWRAFVPPRHPSRDGEGPQPRVLVLVPDAGGSEAVFPDIHGGGTLRAAAARAEVLLLCPRSPSASPASDEILSGVLEEAAAWFPADLARVAGLGHGAGAAQLLLDARRHPERYRALWLVGYPALTDEDLRALREVRIEVVLSALDEGTGPARRRLEMLVERTGHPRAAVRVVEQIPFGMLPGRILDTVLALGW